MFLVNIQILVKLSLNVIRVYDMELTTFINGTTVHYKKTCKQNKDKTQMIGIIIYVPKGNSRLHITYSMYTFF